MKTYPLADGLTASRIGYGCMHLSRACQQTLPCDCGKHVQISLPW